MIIIKNAIKRIILFLIGRRLNALNNILLFFAYFLVILYISPYTSTTLPFKIGLLIGYSYFCLLLGFDFVVNNIDDYQLNSKQIGFIKKGCSFFLFLASLPLIILFEGFFNYLNYLPLITSILVLNYMLGSSKSERKIVLVTSLFLVITLFLTTATLNLKLLTLSIYLIIISLIFNYIHLDSKLKHHDDFLNSINSQIEPLINRLKTIRRKTLKKPETILYVKNKFITLSDSKFYYDNKELEQSSELKNYIDIKNLLFEECKNMTPKINEDGSFFSRMNSKSVTAEIKSEFKLHLALLKIGALLFVTFLYPLKTKDIYSRFFYDNYILLSKKWRENDSQKLHWLDLQMNDKIEYLKSVKYKVIYLSKQFNRLPSDFIIKSLKSLLDSVDEQKIESLIDISKERLNIAENIYKGKSNVIRGFKNVYESNKITYEALQKIKKKLST